MRYPIAVVWLEARAQANEGQPSELPWRGTCIRSDIVVGSSGRGTRDMYNWEPYGLVARKAYRQFQPCCILSPVSVSDRGIQRRSRSIPRAHLLCPRASAYISLTCTQVDLGPGARLARQLKRSFPELGPLIFLRRNHRGQ